MGRAASGAGHAILRALLVVAFGLVHAGCASVSQRPAGQTDLEAILAEADGERIHGDVFELASERYRGRATGTREMKDAMRYVRDRLRDIGIQPAVGDTSYVQRYVVDYNEIRAPARLEAEIGGDTLRFRLLEDFLPHQFSGSGTFSAAEIAVMDSSAIAGGFTGSAGRAVIYLPPSTYETLPGMDAFEVRRLPVQHQFEVARELAAAGARALIIPGASYGRIGNKSVEGLPIYLLGAGAVERLIAAAGESGRLPRLSGEIQTTLHDDVEARNVLAIQPGSDPRLADEVVVVGAHVDHVGTIAGAVYYGAHDNASGTAVMLEVARLLREAVESGMKLRRSVLFAGFSGEEMALLGSRHYVEVDPVVPLERTTAMLNLDIVGGGTGFMMVGALAYPAYHRLVAAVNDEYFGFELLQRDNAPNSDHFYFGDHGVPAGFFYGLDGPPVGIHTPSDTAEKMDPDFMEDAARLALATVWRLANLEPKAATRLRLRADS